jgi:hypothetical protein
MLLEVWGVACDVSFLVCLRPVNKITVISGAIIFHTAEEGLPSLILELNHTPVCRPTYAICGVRSGSKLTMPTFWVLYLRQY